MEVKLGPCLCGQPEKIEAGEDGTPVIVRCPLYQSYKITGTDGKVTEEWKCAIAWMPILQIENRTATDAVAKYTESLRNELIARLDRAERRVAGPGPAPMKTVLEQPSGEA